MRISEFAEIADMSQFHYTMESIDVFQTQPKQYGLFTMYSCGPKNKHGLLIVSQYVIHDY